MPPGYETVKERYPVLYLVDNDELVWMKRGRADIIIDNLIASGKAKPMIVVMANARYKDPAAGEYLDVELPSTKGRLGAWRVPNAQQEQPKQPPQTQGKPGLYQGGGGGGLDEYGLRTGQSVAKDLVPFIDKAYRTVADRDHRAICGASSPGAEAFYGGMTNLPTFAWIGLISGGLPTLPNVSVWLDMPANAAQFFRGPDLLRTIDPEKVAKLMPDMNSNANLRLLYLEVGQNDALLNTQRRMTRLLDEKGLKYIALEVPNQHHDWRSFRWALNDFVPRLFQEAAH
jgi:enterochelin esterase family protein